jgi:hypothetical protein
MNLYKTWSIFRPHVGVTNNQNIFDKSTTMKRNWRFQNYAVSMPTENLYQI